MKRPYIEIMTYIGRRNGLSELFLARIVGADGRKRPCDGNIGTGRQHAESLAKDWAALLGCEVVETIGADSLDPPQLSTPG